VSRKLYNKLVRSEIPTIIRESGRECIYGVLTVKDNKDEIIKLLKEKLVEEANEVLEAIHRGDILEEMGDLYSVYYELKYLMEAGRDIDTIIDAKAIQKGRFCVLTDDNGKPVEKCNSGTPTYYKLIAVDDNEK
jgi:predicted house-cleaning noncanonical NTP pyrophosphatase (MazG superfamily)